MERTDRRRVQRARSLWRLCAAAEVVCARLGARTTVADILKEAKMSRRSYYESFTSLEHMVRTMCKAAREFEWHVPDVPWMLLAWFPTEYGEAEGAFNQARHTVRLGPFERPDDADLLVWASAMATASGEVMAAGVKS